jgi:hypothetical protein
MGHILGVRKKHSDAVKLIEAQFHMFEKSDGLPKDYSWNEDWSYTSPTRKDFSGEVQRWQVL